MFSSPLLSLITLLTPAASAGALDGFYEVYSIRQGETVQNADQRSPEGCWSRDLWVFKDSTLSRGHQEWCDHENTRPTTCEVWVNTEVIFENGVHVPYAAMAVGRFENNAFKQVKKPGLVKRTHRTNAASCELSVPAAQYTVTLDSQSQPFNLLVFSDAARQTVISLKAATPAKAPFTEVRP